jgi:broad-specificity NMP kinase
MKVPNNVHQLMSVRFRPAALKAKTRLLVTHHAQYLPTCDAVVVLSANSMPGAVPCT